MGTRLRCRDGLGITRLLLISLVCLVATLPATQAIGSAAREISLEGAIGPATSRFVVDEIHAATKDKVPLIILRLDTPGGLSLSMRAIIKAILASPTPIVGYVAPSGARAASAGTYILYATSIAAMAPSTNLGAATPVGIDGHHASPDHKDDKKNKGTHQQDISSSATERRKQINDAAAYIRGLAEHSGRNANWAEKAVRHAVSLTATEALDKNVINLLAGNTRDLLEQLDGHTIQTAGGTTTLHTKGLSVQQVEPGWTTKLLSIVTRPAVAYLLFMIGLIGLVAEVFMPGATVPGVVGGICLIVALFAFHLLPVGFGGAALVILGVALLVAEAFVPTFGALGFGGILAIVFGAILFMDSGTMGYDISMGIIIGIAVAAALVLGLMVWLFSRARRARIETGHQGLIGRSCTALDDFEREGRVWLHGESWQAVSATPVSRDQPLTVIAVEGLTVYVRPQEQVLMPDNTGHQP